jgi:multiple sugar transport system permease protein
VRRALIYLALITVSLLYAAPLLWMISTSVKPESQTLRTPPGLVADPWWTTPHVAAQNYSGAWTDPIVNFPLYLRNTLVVAGLSVTGMVLSSAIIAYGFARLQWRGRGTLFAIVLATMMIPFPVLMAPLFLIFRDLGWNGTLRPLWVPAWFGAGFNIFLLRQFYMTIPKELDEAARIDGCSHWGVFWRVILPLSRPALAVVALFHFIAVWNDFLAPLIFLTHRDQFTLALGLQLYQSQAGNTPWNLLMAASTLVVLPVLVLFFLTQRTFVRGIATQGLKE